MKDVMSEPKMDRPTLGEVPAKVSDVVYKQILDPDRDDDEIYYMVLYDYKHKTYTFKFVISKEMRTLSMVPLEEIVCIHVDSDIERRKL